MELRNTSSLSLTRARGFVSVKYLNGGAPRVQLELDRRQHTVHTKYCHPALVSHRGFFAMEEVDAAGGQSPTGHQRPTARVFTLARIDTPNMAAQDWLCRWVEVAEMLGDA